MKPQQVDFISPTSSIVHFLFTSSNRLFRSYDRCSFPVSGFHSRSIALRRFLCIAPACIGASCINHAFFVSASSLNITPDCECNYTSKMEKRIFFRHRNRPDHNDAGHGVTLHFCRWHQFMSFWRGGNRVFLHHQGATDHQWTARKDKSSSPESAGTPEVPLFKTAAHSSAESACLFLLISRNIIQHKKKKKTPCPSSLLWPTE